MDRRIEGKKIIDIDVLEHVYNHLQAATAWVTIE